MNFTLPGHPSEQGTRKPPIPVGINLLSLITALWHWRCWRTALTFVLVESSTAGWTPRPCNCLLQKSTVFKITCTLKSALSRLVAQTACAGDEWNKILVSLGQVIVVLSGTSSFLQKKKEVYFTLHHVYSLSTYKYCISSTRHIQTKPEEEHYHSSHLCRTQSISTTVYYRSGECKTTEVTTGWGEIPGR